MLGSSESTARSRLRRRRYRTERGTPMARPPCSSLTKSRPLRWSRFRWTSHPRKVPAPSVSRSTSSSKQPGSTRSEVASSVRTIRPALVANTVPAPKPAGRGSIPGALGPSGRHSATACLRTSGRDRCPTSAAALLMSEPGQKQGARGVTSNGSEEGSVCRKYSYSSMQKRDGPAPSSSARSSKGRSASIRRSSWSPSLWMLGP